jgi:hypothetical protein
MLKIQLFAIVVHAWANSPNSWSFPPSHQSNPCSLNIPRGTNPLISESDGQFTQVVYDDSIQVGLTLAKYLAYSSGANANSSPSLSYSSQLLSTTASSSSIYTYPPIQNPLRSGYCLVSYCPYFQQKLAKKSRSKFLILV